MILSERHIIKPSNKHYKDLRYLMYLSKNLYNATLYEIRQYYFENNKYFQYNDINKKFVSESNKDYRSLPAQVSQQTMKVVDKNFISFFQSVQKGIKSARIPKYLDKEGYFELIYTNQTISKKHLKEGKIKLAKTNISFNTKQTNIKQVRFIPRLNYIVMEVLYDRPIEKLVSGNNSMGIDIGINNLATCISSEFEHPIIINGRPVKSINQYYNKQLSEYKSNKRSKHLIYSLCLKRDNKINDYFHKATRYITNQAVSHNISLIVIGHNKEWKQDVSTKSKIKDKDTRKRNNQNFVSIPYNKFINMLKYKCELVGIKVVETEESYTSKASYLDNDFIPTYGDKDIKQFSGRRTKRGLYRTSDKTNINADVNGSCNILKKYIVTNEVWNTSKLPDRGCVLQPVRINF